MTLAALQHEMDGLPAAKRAVVESSILGVGEAVLARAGELAPLPGAWRAALVQGLTQVVVALLKQDPDQLQRIAEVLRERPRARERETDERSELEAENLLRVLVLARQVERESLTARQLQVSRQRLNQLRDEGKLLGVKLPMHREFVYPRWQFGRSARVLPVVPRLLAAARAAGLDGLDLHLLMTGNRVRGERPLVDHVRRGDQDDERYVLEVIRAAGSGEG